MIVVGIRVCEIVLLSRRYTYKVQSRRTYRLQTQTKVLSWIVYSIVYRDYDIAIGIDVEIQIARSEKHKWKQDVLRGKGWVSTCGVPP